MICIIQRVTEAQVMVGSEVSGKIGPGMLVLAAVQRGDTPAEAKWMAGKLAALRIFRAGDKHFDIDVREAGGSVLLVSNFTVAAWTRKGRRPSFDDAADPAEAERLFNDLVGAVRAEGIPVETGRFGADMRVSSINDGPATFIVKTDPKTKDEDGRMKDEGQGGGL